MQFAVNFTVLLAAVLTVLSAPHTSEARPAVNPHITIPVRRLDDGRISDIHPSIVAAQHINRANIRLAKMKGREAPPTHELLSNIHRRMSDLSPTVQKRYNQDGIAEAIATLKSVFLPDSDTSKPATSNEGFAKASSNATSAPTSSAKQSVSSAAKNATSSAGYSAKEAAAAAANALTKAKAATFVHSLGLDIEGNDIGYVGDVAIGTPPRNFRLLMDSGSSDLWVGAESCQSDDGGACSKKTLLGPKNSTSFKDLNQDWSITYGSGDVSGTMCQDNLAIGDLKLTGQKFGVAKNESSQFSGGDVPLDGLMGLGKSQLSNQKVDTVVESMQKQGLIKDAITSYKLSRFSDGKNDGEVTFGAMDPAKYDASSLITFKNVNQDGYWEGNISSFKMNGKDLKLTGKSGILDTGTTMLVGPANDVKTVHNAIPGSKSKNGADWTIPCTTTSKLSLNFGGKDFQIDPRDLSFLPSDPKNLKGDCQSAISAGSIGGQNEWLVGDVFLKNVYFSTNVGTDEISLANLK